MKKDNNQKKFPMAKKQPRHTYADKIGRAQARQEYSNGLTLEQKIANLPPEPAAQKVRAKYLAKLTKQNAKPVASAEVKPATEEVSKEEKKEAKRYMRDHQE